MRSIYRFGPFEFDTHAFVLLHHGRRRRLSASLAKLLVLFLDHPGELVLREQIGACLWDEPEYIDAPSGINTAVNRLRVVLGDTAANPLYIETVVKLGYRFVAAVERAPESSPGLSSAEEAIAPPKPIESAIPLAVPLAGQGAVQEQAREDALPGNRETPGLVEARVPYARVSGVSVKRWVVLALVPLVLLGAALLIYRMKRIDRTTTVTPLAIAPNVLFPQATFNDEDNPVYAQSLSHDGRRIAFSDREGLTVRDLDSGVNRLVPTPHGLHVNRISWYPAGEQLLVSGTESEGAERGGQVGRQPAEEVWSVSLRAEAPRLLLKDAAEAVISPDGRRIAYVNPQRTEIWLAGAAEKSPRMLQGSLADRILASLLWAPSGGRLVFESCRTPTVADVAGASKEAQRRFQCDYESMSASTGMLLASEKDIRFDSAFLLANGDMYFPEKNLSDERIQPRLLGVKTDPVNGRFLTTPREARKLPNYLVLNITASDDGREMAALVEHSSADVYVGEVRFPGPRLEQVHRLVHIAPDNYPHSWTPDADAVLFESDDANYYAIYEQKLDGSPARLLARSPENGVLPQLTPNGQWVLFENFVTLHDSHPNAIFRVPLNGGKLQQVTTHGSINDFSCSVSPKGRCVLREKINNDFVYFALDPVLGQGAELGRTVWGENMLGDWSLSPDGTTVASVLHDPEHPGIRLVKLSTGAPSATLDLAVPGFGILRGLCWAQDARGFYVQTRTASGFALLYLDRKGRATLLRRSGSPIWGVPSRSGTKLAFVDQTSNVNVWISLGASGDTMENNSR